MIYPIEGYVVQCDLCGEKDVFYENANYKNSLEIDEEKRMERYFVKIV